MSKVSFEIDISKSDLSPEEILINICDCNNLSDLSMFFEKHHIKLENNPRYDKNDYFKVCEALRNEEATDFAKMQYSHWLAKVGNRMFSMEKRIGGREK